MLFYLRGTFERGARYKLASELWRSFASTTGFSEKHVRERAFPGFREWCTEFKFERIRYGPGRGRSWAWKITRNFGVLGSVDAEEVRARLLGAIVKVARGRHGVARVDAEFLRKFCEISKLPAEAVEAVWRRLENLPGHQCRWRGEGGGRKFVVQRPQPENSISSYPQTSGVISSPTGRRDQTSGASAPEDPQTDRALAALATNGPGEESSGGVAASSSSLGAPTHRPPRVWGQAPPAFVVADRWVSGWKLLARAVWLTRARLAGAHESLNRVRFSFPHARNFANRAMRAGYGDAAICRAYAIGVGESHEDALDRDRLPGGGYASQREPSAAVVYAWRELRAADPREAADRWREFFAGPRRTAGERSPVIENKKVGRAASELPAAPEMARGSRGAPRFTAAEAAARLAELRRQVAPTAARAETGAAISAGQLAEWLRGRGLTLAQFNAFSWQMRQSYIALARASLHQSPD